MKRKSLIRTLAIIAGFVLLIWAFTMVNSKDRDYTPVSTGLVLSQLQANNVTDVQIDDREQTLRVTIDKPIDGVEGKKIFAKYPAGTSRDILADVQDAKTPDGKPLQDYTTNVTAESIWQSVLFMLLPILLLVGLFFFLMNRMQGGGRGGVMGFGKSKAKQLTKDMPKTTFADVAGADEAVEELYEIKDFLQNPARYQALGAKIPKGVLLYGPPGTGKTLLARAVAGEAGVPFFTISGSDFVEMFVGVGASRVRDLFEQAKENSPCIIFVDEIDAVGRQRGAGMGGGHDEREQTLNQLLVEMDGFGDRQGIILIAATNRPDILDPALLRPGRFDRQIPVSNPDMAGRKAILEVHAKGKPLADDVDLSGLAKRTPGMSGADLANVINEAALLTARENGSQITAPILEESVDRVVGGPRRKNRIISEHEKKVTAYHEGGHTLAAWATEGLDPVYKVTVLARGRTGGHALAVPENDKGMYTRNEMIGRLIFAMGGRAAEELVFAEPTTGASSDIDQATKIARGMVTEYGMSARLGAVRYGQDDGDPFVGRGIGSGAQYSEAVASQIDEEVRSLVEAAHTEAWAILNEYRDVLDVLAGELLEKETLVRKDLERIFASVEKRPRITQFDDFGTRTPSTKPPIKTPKEIAIENGDPWPPVDEEAERKKAEQAALAAAAAPSGQNGQVNGQGPQAQPWPVPGGQPGYGQGYGQPGYQWGGQSQGYPGPQYPNQPYPGQSGGYPPAPNPYPQPGQYGQPPAGGSRPDYGAPAGWSAPGWPPQGQPGQQPGQAPQGQDPEQKSGPDRSSES
ncbi:ATP-dependent zinc metalloprotease FtsH OS=Tsukamurella paurometabola (strain ATCC 8368 / DSM/ CCUG 35730 / CIP 100753 / JCM 10117 / KCTC 9821 / NBRC 16120/ NCIMB 702349 / NCTC 13040) OX=521096 GN=ftsH PE=3 SV=1 [Tsukamurella paurometabola]|uniref:ATP-dependent zinc metalloprotease FtsH n=1 Tax=Tsukamurella paurometabola (strain ATCC 8368 / DSM 20162 / CCUG 35730 / CIP 100753 / JCM 10117 / KCTC 9821 / NBRC 16120 / NCIMB 702349 / NCTC 13040) TaxID=521096 RepID=D5USD2_TSUPD|nr:ATP-dependent zinc metalloprotease FtsH [Tsukamurella paurometabola]ADG77199.1 ATP-dependent metalloprotease FtsH [Tsukamurella paurometabola DSM 20162]SUP43132.1 ATP-dependent zinc metalloprotease FtsH [Tsukamurella paurometabola]